MTIRFSTGARNGQAGASGFLSMFNKGYMGIFTGSQPASADAAHGSTLLGLITVGSGTLTRETRAAGSVTITGATGGTITNITVGGLNIIPDGAVPWVTGDTTSTLASRLADAVNRNGLFEARVAANVVTLYGRPGTGVTTATVAGSLTTVTATYIAMGTAVAGVAPVNGLTLLNPVAGVITKSTEAWSMVGIAAGTAGWFRFFSSDTADSAGALLSAAPWYPRIDGSCGVGTGDAQLSSLAVTIGSPHTVDVFSITFPAA